MTIKIISEVDLGMRRGRLVDNEIREYRKN